MPLSFVIGHSTSARTRRTRRPRLRLLAIVALLCIAHANARAQTDADDALRRQIERTRQQQRELQPQADALRPPAPASAPGELPDERPCFTIDDIELIGPDAPRFRWLTSSVDRYLGRCIGVQGLQRIAETLDAQLIEQGFVTSRVTLPPQNLSSGRLVVRLHAGRIAEVRMLRADEPGAVDTRWGTWVNAFPTRAGRRLDARDLEQGVEQMNRLPSQSVVTTLAPGAEPDTSILTIERRAGSIGERLRGGITLDNSGSASLGRTQAAANVAVDNPLGLNDIVGLGVNSNLEQLGAQHRSQGASVSVSIPFGYSTFSAGASHNRFAQQIQLTTTRVLSSGESDGASLRWDHVAWRTASSRTGVYAELSTRKARSFIDDTELLVQRRRTTFVETGVAFRHLFANRASIDVTLGYRRGMPWLDAQDDLPAESGLTLRPRLWTLNAGAMLPLPGGWQYSAQLRAQTTPDRTLAIDQIAIGSRASVRGFDGDAVLIAENGWVLRNELSTPLLNTLLRRAPIDASIYVGIDFGRVWGASADMLPGQALAGAVVGLRARHRALQFDFALATALAKPAAFKTSRINPTLSATWSF